MITDKLLKEILRQIIMDEMILIDQNYLIDIILTMTDKCQFTTDIDIVIFKKIIEI